MKIRRPRVPLLVRLRKVLLVVAILFIVGLYGLYRFGRSGIQEPSTPPPLTSEVGTEENVATRSEGFDYTQYEEGEPLFRVQGGTNTVDLEGNANLQQVRITLYREDGDYVATSKEGLYRQQESSAELEGEVYLEGPENLQIWSETLRVGSEGSRVESPTPVRFGYGDGITGSARSLRVEVPAEVLILQGDVTFRGRAEDDGQPAVLTADRGFFEASQRLLRAEGGVQLVNGGSKLSTVRLSAYLAEDSDRITFVRAKWKVRGEILLPGSAVSSVAGGAELAPAVPMGYAGGAMAALMAEDGRNLQQVELQGGAGQPALFNSTDPETGHWRRLTANVLTADFEAGVLATVQALGQVYITEADRRGGTLLREARAERANGRFGPAGALAGVLLAGNFTYRDGAITFNGRRADLDFVGGISELSGGPVEVRDPSGDLDAPRVRYNRDGERVQAFGGVRTRLRDTTAGNALPGPMMRRGEGPVWVESDSAIWHRDRELYVFRDGVRAWRGKDLLLADEVRVQRPEDLLSAKGNVKTVWFPPPSSDPSEGGGARRAGDSGVIEVDAGNFTYLGAERKLRYEENVVILRDDLRLACQGADVLLAEVGGLNRLTCGGSASLQDLRQGRTVRGRRLVYDPDAGTIDVVGNPVRVKDRQGSELTGQRVIYQLESGTFEFKGPPKATEERQEP
ncbi:MAG: LptA/OstA family protein [Acidobacteriota bacterium]